MTSPAVRPLPVWDAAVRQFHWLLVLAIALAAGTGFILNASWLGLHIAGGVAAMALAVFRLIWGFTGSTHSRFASFLPRLPDVIAHVKTLSHRPHVAHAGHNPLGALMVFALLATVLLLGFTGLGVLGGMFKQGPLKALLSFDTGRSLREIHELAAWGLLLMVVGHVLGVIYESRRAADNLVRAMVTGEKVLTPAAIAAPHNQRTPTPARPLSALALSLAVTALAIPPALMGLKTAAPGVPTAPLDHAYATTCGDCHMAYHPSLLPAARWRDIMAHLDDHFGEDATLPAGYGDKISAYLSANSAEHWDTLPAHAFAANTSAEPLRLTTTRFWQRMHGDIPAAVFARKSITAKSNCQACHRDAASGLFAPQMIDVPKE